MAGGGGGGGGALVSAACLHDTGFAIKNCIYDCRNNTTLLAVPSFILFQNATYLLLTIMSFADLERAVLGWDCLF